MDIPVLFILFGTVFLAAVVHGISGFAFGIIVLMVLPYVFNYVQSLALTAFMMAFVLAYNTFLYRKTINWKPIPLALGVFIIVDFLAVKLLKYVGENPIWYILLGIIFIFMAVYIAWGQNKFKIHPTLFNAVLFNGLSGFINGLFGVGGPIAAVYFLAISKNKEEYLGTTQMLFLLSVIIDVTLRIVNGMVTKTIVFYGISSLWCIVLGLLVGKKLFAKMNAATFRKIICALMLLNGINMFLR